ncbi:MAG: glycosyltransferase [Alphaproteobacteria bacterium]
MLSVIIPARNNPRATADCVRSAIHSLYMLGLKCQIILIDDFSDPADGMLEVFRGLREFGKSQHDFTIVRTARNEHYTGVFAIGLSLVERHDAFFLSNDMMITPSFFSAVLGVAELSPDFGIVRGTSAYTDCHPEHEVPGPALNSYDDIKAFSRTVYEQKGLTYTEDNRLSGDAVLIRRPLLDAIGVFDPRFFSYFGDLDYGMRADLAGFKLVCAKGAWLHHAGEGYIRSEARARNADLAQLRAKRTAVVNEAYRIFRDKWGTRICRNTSSAG